MQPFVCFCVITFNKGKLFTDYYLLLRGSYEKFTKKLHTINNSCIVANALN